MRALFISLAVVVALTHAPGASAQTAAGTGGPDAFGYTFQPVTEEFLPLTTVGLAVPLATGDDGTVDVALPWPFPFYDGSYSLLAVSGNGGISFTPGQLLSHANGELPTASAGPDIAVFWDDLNPDQGGGVFAFHEWVDNDGDGQPEIDRFIVSWEDVPRFFSVGGGSFQAQLYPSGEIQLHWEDTLFGDAAYNYGASATVGIQDRSTENHLLGRALQLSANEPDVFGGDARSFQVCLTDTDGDGASDFAELKAGSDPLDASSLPAPQGNLPS